MSAEKYRSNGAPLEIWAKKFPDEPNESFTVFPVCSSNSATISLNAKFKSEAAAMETSPAHAETAQAPPSHPANAIPTMRRATRLSMRSSVPELELRGEKVLVVRIGIPAAVLVMLDLVVHGQFYIRVKIVVEAERVPVERVVGPVRINGDLFIPILRLEVRQPGEGPVQDILVPAPAPKAVVVTFDVFGLEFHPREARRDVRVHHALPEFLDISVLLQWARGRTSIKVGPGIAGQM